MPYLSIKDIQVYYEVHGQGEPLLLIHGLGSSTQDWEYQVKFFTQYQIIAFDLRGHGKSDKPKEPYTVKQFASDTAQLCRALSVQSVHVVGHSLGGMVAFQLALDFPDLVKTMTIVNSAPMVTFPRFIDSFKFFLRSVNVKLFGMRPLSIGLSKILFPKPEQVDLRELFVQRWCENDPVAYLHALHAFKGWTVLNRLSELQCPTLIVTADHDYTPVSLKEYYAKFIAKSELVVIKDSRHITIVDQAEAFNQVLLKFLQKQRSQNT